MTFVGSRLLVTLLCLAAFGPYVVGSVRTEQLAVYGLAPLVLFAFINLRQWSLKLVLAWTATLLVAFLGLLLPYTGPAPWVTGSVIANLDNWVLPLMVMLAVWSLVPTEAAPAALRTAARVIVLLAAVNAVVAIASSLDPSLLQHLRPFWSGEAGITTAEKSVTMGRYTGVIGQPAEAGLIYSVAAVLAAWIFAKRPLLMYVFLAVISIGGVLCSSKVFLFVGAPICAVQLLITRRGKDRIGLLVAVYAITMAVISSGFLQQWDGLDFISRLYQPAAGQSTVELYTAGRWNEGANMMDVFGFIMGASALVGMGIGGLKVAYDSQWTETMVFGGVLSTVAMIVVLVMLLRSFRRVRDLDMRIMALAFWAVLVGASFGIPALTANRAATLVWVVAALLAAIASRAAKGEAETTLPLTAESGTLPATPPRHTRM